MSEEQSHYSQMPEYLRKEIELSDRAAELIIPKYEKKYALKFIYERQNRFLIDFLKKQNVSRITEIGCGFGNFLVQAIKDFPQVTGIDPSLKRVEAARKILPQADIRLGWGEKIPFTNHEIDAIVMKGVVHHLENPEIVFQECLRVLKPGGLLVIFEGNCSSLYRRAVLRLADLAGVQHEASPFPHRSPKEIFNILKAVGLESFSHKNISGFFSPLALAGFGGRGIWKLCGSIEDVFQLIAPSLFNYYVLLSARKPMT